MNLFIFIKRIYIYIYGEEKTGRKKMKRRREENAE